jgi:Tfp pilus assembly protein PilE
MRDMRDERGFVLRALVITLIVLAVLGLAAYDAGAVFLARYRAQELADKTVDDAIIQLRAGKDTNQVCEAAQASLEVNDPTARIPKKGCIVNPDPKIQSVTITVRKDANTLVVQHISALSKWAVASESSTASRTSL